MEGLIVNAVLLMLTVSPLDPSLLIVIPDTNTSGVDSISVNVECWYSENEVYTAKFHEVDNTVIWMFDNEPEYMNGPKVDTTQLTPYESVDAIVYKGVAFPPSIPAIPLSVVICSAYTDDTCR